MIFTDITTLITAVRNELGSLQNAFTDDDITNVANNALIIHNKILKGYYLTYQDLTYTDGLITVDDTKLVWKLRYIDDSGKYQIVEYEDFTQIEDQLQVILPSYVDTVRVYYIEEYTIDNMSPDNIQLAFVYLVCDILLKQRANPYSNIKSIADGIMTVSYDTRILNSPDNSKYMKLYYQLIYKETSGKGDIA